MPHPVTGLPVVGMIGGGQLARMTHQAAISLGLSLRVLAASPEDSAALIASDVPVGSHTDTDDLLAFAAGCDVVTFDHEHVPPAQLAALVATGVLVHPSPEALIYAQDKLVQRRMARELAASGLIEIAIPEFAEVDGPGDVTRFADRFGWPVALKAVRGGYDGRGVWIVNSPEEIPDAGDTPLYVEQCVPIARELAVMVARSPSGEVACWPVVETVQEDGICTELLAPAPDLDPDAARRITATIQTLADRLGVTGVMAMEVFCDTSGKLWLNELAMRPHNSGHWTIEGSRTSQFAQHLRAILDWPLGETTPTAPVVALANLLGGDHTDFAVSLPAALGIDRGARIHLYGKGPRPGRKLGHITCLGEQMDETRKRAVRTMRVVRDGPPKGSH